MELLKPDIINDRSIKIIGTAFGQSPENVLGIKDSLSTFYPKKINPPSEIKIRSRKCAQIFDDFSIALDNW